MMMMMMEEDLMQQQEERVLGAQTPSSRKLLTWGVFPVKKLFWRIPRSLTLVISITPSTVSRVPASDHPSCYCWFDPSIDPTTTTHLIFSQLLMSSVPLVPEWLQRVVVLTSSSSIFIIHHLIRVINPNTGQHRHHCYYFHQNLLLTSWISCRTNKLLTDIWQKVQDHRHHHLSFIHSSLDQIFIQTSPSLYLLEF